MMPTEMKNPVKNFMSIIKMPLESAMNLCIIKNPVKNSMNKMENPEWRMMSVEYSVMENPMKPNEMNWIQTGYKQSLLSRAYTY